jgi:aspartyl-tRNA synthetase
VEATPWFDAHPFGLGERPSSGFVARALRVPGAAYEPRRFFDELGELATSNGAALYSYAVLKDELKGPLARVRPDLAPLLESAGAESGDALILVVGPRGSLERAAGALRSEVGERLGLIERERYRFCWVVDFPMYERSRETGKLEFLHNPFSMPQGGLAALTGDPEAVLAHQYDIVCNGIELSSGAVRNHRPDVMLRVFELAGYGAGEVERRFGALLSAFKFGAPPHGGLAPGIDRMLMLLANEANLREVIAFPLNQSAEDLLMHAPGEVGPDELAELGLRVEPRSAGD